MERWVRPWPAERPGAQLLCCFTFGYKQRLGFVATPPARPPTCRPGQRGCLPRWPCKGPSWKQPRPPRPGPPPTPPPRPARTLAGWPPAPGSDEGGRSHGSHTPPAGAAQWASGPLGPAPAGTGNAVLTSGKPAFLFLKPGAPGQGRPVPLLPRGLGLIPTGEPADPAAPRTLRARAPAGYPPVAVRVLVVDGVAPGVVHPAGAPAAAATAAATAAAAVGHLVAQVGAGLCAGHTAQRVDPRVGPSVAAHVGGHSESHSAPRHKRGGDRLGEGRGQRASKAKTPGREREAEVWRGRSSPPGRRG